MGKHASATHGSQLRAVLLGPVYIYIYIYIYLHLALFRLHVSCKNDDSLTHEVHKESSKQYQQVAPGGGDGQSVTHVSCHSSLRCLKNEQHATWANTDCEFILHPHFHSIYSCKISSIDKQYCLNTTTIAAFILH